MVVQFSRWGNSLALRIPNALARELDVTEGKRADVQLRDGSLIVTPVDVVPTYDVNELIAAITPENLHDECDTGEPVGNEFR
jgi:antitoxin MazE